MVTTWPRGLAGVWDSVERFTNNVNTMSGGTLTIDPKGAGELVGALESFEAALESHPNNAWALWGVWQAEEALAVDQGDAGNVIAARRAFERAWLGEGEPSLDRL